jgi:hypothetical protein
VLGLETFEEILRRERSSAGSSSTSSTRRDLGTERGGATPVRVDVSAAILMARDRLFENRVDERPGEVDRECVLLVGAMR